MIVIDWKSSIDQETFANSEEGKAFTVALGDVFDLVAKKPLKSTY